MSLEEIRQEAEAFLEELVEEEYKNRAGLKTKAGLSVIYEKYPRLASQSLFFELEGMAREGQGEEGKGIGFLKEFIAQNTLDSEVREITDRIFTWEATQLLEGEGRALSFRSAEVEIKNQGLRPMREAIEEARCQALREINPLLADYWKRVHEGALRLGFGNYTRMCQEHSGVKLFPLRDMVDGLLKGTQDVYGDLLRWFLKRELGVKLDQAQRHDLVYLFRAKGYDRVFLPTALVNGAERCLKRMRLDPEAGGRLSWDLEPRETKAARAFAASIRVPERIILVVRPGGGYDDYLAFFHELGHGLHYGYTDPDLPLEFRRLGDPSVAEVHAFTLEGLVRERGWLRYFLDFPDSKDFLRLAYLHKLYLVRRYAAKLHYELILHDGGSLEEKRGVYREVLTRATMAEYPEELYLYDVDPYFYTGRYLRAWLFEAQLKRYLYEHFDEEWFRNDRTGPFLKGLWRDGQRYTLEELASNLGLEELSIDPLIQEIGQYLG
ncbi:MAG: hypothetical protein HY998_03980 [candidate division NC10 bacterium]|nr:hypothetical protein [candidate division NC10 bacterium]